MPQLKPPITDYTKSSFPATLSNIITEFDVSRRPRRTSVIDITDSEGKFEKSVEIASDVEVKPKATSSMA